MFASKNWSVFSLAFRIINYSQIRQDFKGNNPERLTKYAMKSPSVLTWKANCTKIISFVDPGRLNLCFFKFLFMISFIFVCSFPSINNKKSSSLAYARTHTHIHRASIHARTQKVILAYSFKLKYPHKSADFS